MTIRRLTTALACWLMIQSGVWPAAGRTPRADASGQATESWRSLQGEARTADEAQRFLLQIMESARLQALSVAVVQDRRVVFERMLGVVDRKTRTPADAETVLRTASLSKPVFSYLVMTLIDSGVLSLDQPLTDVVDPPFVSYPSYAALAADSRHRAITPGILLSHAAGFPNWRRPRDTGVLAMAFTPGTGFSYSGEGYELLQFVLEKKTGLGLSALARRQVFEPLGMTHSSFLWEDRFDSHAAIQLDTELAPLIRRTRTRASAAASLLTNASDYARFLLAALTGRGLKPATWRTWLTPRVAVNSRALHDTRPSPGAAGPRLRWTPGWGWIDTPVGPALFHVGMEEGCENYAVFFPEQQTGIVLQSASDLSVRVTPDIAGRLIGDVYSPFEWMGYR